MATEKNKICMKNVDLPKFLEDLKENDLESLAFMVFRYSELYRIYSLLDEIVHSDYLCEHELDRLKELRSFFINSANTLFDDFRFNEI